MKPGGRGSSFEFINLNLDWVSIRDWSGIERSFGAGRDRAGA
jgi:hypothetical protein